MMMHQELRSTVANFLKEIRLGVAKLVAENPNSFDFGSYVTEWDRTTECGTVCCMEGWVPQLRPDLATWKKYKFSDGEPYLRVGGKNIDRFFSPQVEGIPMQDDLWTALTRPGYQAFINETQLHMDSPFRDVHDLWERTETRLLAGELDEFLVFPIHSY